jgi:hypothetical protein
MHIVQERVAPNETKYRVYTANGALVYIGNSANVAQEIYENGEADELQRKKYAKLRRNDSSSGPSNSG